MAEIEIRIGAQRFAGWKTASVKRTIEDVCSTFSLSVTDKWATDSKPWEIREGADASILVASKVRTVGIVDAREVEFSTSSHSITLTGRGKPSLLVDNSFDLGSWEFRKVHLLDFVTRIGAQHGVTVELGPGVILPPVPSEVFAVTPGDTSFQVLDRVCRFAGILPVENERGGITLIKPGVTVAPVALVEGVNLLGGSASFNHSERFSSYVVLGQDSEGKSVRATATDSGVKQKRELVLQADGAVSQSQAQARANWEASTRAARSERVTVPVQGWEMVPGQLWNPGDLVTVTAPRLGVSGQLVIASADMTLDGGTKTILELMRPDAFSPELNRAEAWKQ